MVRKDCLAAERKVAARAAATVVSPDLVIHQSTRRLQVVVASKGALMANWLIERHASVGRQVLHADVGEEDTTGSEWVQVRRVGRIDHVGDIAGVGNF